MITSHDPWFLLAVTATDPKKKAAHVTPPGYHFCLAWHHDFVMPHGREETPAEVALEAVRAALN